VCCVSGNPHPHPAYELILGAQEASIRIRHVRLLSWHAGPLSQIQIGFFILKQNGERKRGETEKKRKRRVTRRMGGGRWETGKSGASSQNQEKKGRAR
jgi:hypothetical protein